MVGHNGFIAGGCFKNIFSGNKIKDLDIFFESETDFVKAASYYDSECKNQKYQTYYENKKVKAYKHKATGIIVELIRHTYGSPKDVLNRFDFTVTKFAYIKKLVEEPETKEINIEYAVLCHSLFFEHLIQKRLVVDDKMLFPISTFERSYRYAKYGFFPCKETKLKIINAIRDIPSESDVDLSSGLYDGLE